jgi:hypothetical protein
VVAALPFLDAPAAGGRGAAEPALLPFGTVALAWLFRIAPPFDSRRHHS